MYPNEQNTQWCSLKAKEIQLKVATSLVNEVHKILKIINTFLSETSEVENTEREEKERALREITMQLLIF